MVVEKPLKVAKFVLYDDVSMGQIGLPSPRGVHISKNGTIVYYHSVMFIVIIIIYVIVIVAIIIVIVIIIITNRNPSLCLHDSVRR